MKIPIWLLVLALIAAGAGAAVGTILAGQVTGEIPVTVSQAIVLNKKPTIGGNPYNSFVTMSDDHTAFMAAAEVYNGDEFTVSLAVNNRAKEDVIALLMLEHEPPIQLNVTGMNDASNVIRIAEDQWKFKLGPNQDNTNDLKIEVALPDDAEPGFYKIKGTIKAVNY